MTNKAEYPSEELVLQWMESIITDDPVSYSRQLCTKAIEWALQGAEPVAWLEDMKKLRDKWNDLTTIQKLNLSQRCMQAAIESAPPTESKGCAGKDV